MFNRLADSNPFGQIRFQPRIGGTDPDLVVSFEPNEFSQGAAITNIADPSLGATGGIHYMDAGRPATIFFEVKVGSDFNNLLKGAGQAAATAAAVGTNANMASALVVDATVYNNLSQDEQTRLQSKAGGAFIQLQPNLTQDAVGLAARTRRGASDATSKYVHWDHDWEVMQ
jgi:hypothetical protein